MTTITTTDVTNGTLTDASVMNANFGAVKTVVNGNIDNANIASGAAIALTKLAQTGATAGQAVIWDGSAWAPGDATNLNRLDYVYTDVSDTNTSAEETIYTKTITGGTLGTTGAMRLLLWGDYVRNNAQNWTWRWKLGGTTILAWTFTATNLGATRVGFWGELTVANQNSESAQANLIRWCNTSGAGNGDAPSTGYGRFSIGDTNADPTHSGIAVSTSTVNTASNCDLVVTHQWAGSSTSLDINVYGAILHEV
jgi:hypothetical protein